jgi:hypothetical protein
LTSGLRTTRPTPAVYAASLASIAIGLTFVFWRAPHPWGWDGIDGYHDLALALARGEAFPTSDRSWGYAYFLAPFYRLFGDRPWIPLVAQVLLNGVVPLLVYRLVSLEFDRRTAVVTAVLTGFLSFNTVYASTQSADALCTVIVIAALLAFAEARAGRRAPWFGLAGLLLGLAPQFRPNLVLLPPTLAALYVFVRPRDRRKLIEIAVFLLAASLALAPWTIRNYRSTGLVLPTSTHGGVQLWYGSLQTGPYLRSYVYNPRSNFEHSPFDYSSVAGRPLVISVDVAPCASPPASIWLVYWTDRQKSPVRIPPVRTAGRQYSWDVPGQPIPTTLYSFVEASWSGAVQRLPSAGPAVHFINDAHLFDLDAHSDFLDVFDIVRLVRAIAWGEQTPDLGWLDLDHDGRLTTQDLRRAAAILIRSRPEPLPTEEVVSGFRVDEGHAVLEFADASSLTIPRKFSGKVSELLADGDYAGRLVRAAVPVSVLDTTHLLAPVAAACDRLRNLGVNRPFYLSEPDSMRRYTMLALDNIRADLPAYLASCVYRAWRLFVVVGTDDMKTTVQFPGSRVVYLTATVFSLSYFLLFIPGVVIAVWQRRPLLVLGAPILYVPATIAGMLTNMRYTVTVQPLVFAFVAVLVVAVYDRVRMPKRIDAMADELRREQA